MLDLSDTVALVTGAAGGIGAAVCALFEELGATVIGADLETGDRVTLNLDVGDPDQWEQGVGAVLRREQRLDALVNAAGIAGRVPLIDGDLEEFDRVVRVNQRGTFLGMAAVAPAMRAQGTGAIVNVSSTAAIAPVPGVSPYAASKAGVIALTKTAALELGPAGIRVNAVVPGGFDTAMNRNDREAYRSIPLGRIGAPRELAQTVAFLTSSAASYCTGATLVVDGGWTIGPPPPRPDFATPVKPTD